MEILEGKDAGKQGKVVQVIRERNWVVLEGLNTVSEEWGCECSGSLSHPSLSVRAAQGLVLAEGTVRPPSLLFFNMGWMRRAAVGKLPAFPVVSDNPFFLDSITAILAGPRISEEP